MQSFTDFEIVVTDDGSTDGTADVVRSFGDPRIRLSVFSENKGANIAMNDAIGRARGTYIAVLNSDDYYLPEKLQKQVEALDARPDLAAVFALPSIVNESGEALPDHPTASVFKAKSQSRHEWLRHFFFHGNALCHPTLMIRRKCYSEVGGYDDRLFQFPDFDMWVRLCSACEIDVMPEQMTAFRIMENEANASGARPEVHVRTMWEFGRILQHFRKLSDADFRSVFFLDLEKNDLLDAHRDVALARLAISTHIPAHELFGLDILFESVGAGHAGITAKELSSLAKVVDPYNVIGRINTGVTEAALKQSLADLNQCKEELSAIKRHASWRLTAPLRQIGNALRQN